MFFLPVAIYKIGPWDEASKYDDSKWQVQLTASLFFNLGQAT